eukprot:40206-Hanusia_phi.AAC.1
MELAMFPIHSPVSSCHHLHFSSPIFQHRALIAFRPPAALWDCVYRRCLKAAGRSDGCANPVLYAWQAMSCYSCCSSSSSSTFSSAQSSSFASSSS